MPIYKYIIDENSTYFREDAIIVNHTQLKIKKKNFDAVWNSYYSNYSLNELILLWMPLTIDIQGLSKLKHDGSDKNYSEYLGKIKDKWKNREISSLKKEHNKIIKCLESEENKEEMNSLKEKYNKIIAILENKHIEEIKENMLVDLSKLTHY